MKVLRSSLWLLFSGLLFSLISVTQAAQYDPLKTESGKSAAPIDLTMQDQSRNRDIPLRIYLKDGRAKVEIAIAKGKRKGDKRQKISKRETEREIQKALRRR